jgi:glycosyltransferase involved in cell wall biosynthesis
MRVSILIPTFNRLGFLREALESARRQTASAHEILVSDDGSLDDTRAYVTSIAAVDSRVKLLTDNRSPGIFTNMNFLVTNATGDAYCILGDDDRLHPTFVERLSAPLVANPEVAASFCDHWIIDPEGRPDVGATENNSRTWGRTGLRGGLSGAPLTIALRQTLCIGFALFRSVKRETGPFDILCGGAADVDLTIRLAAEGRFFYVPDRLGDYRYHHGTATHSKARYMREGLIYALNKHHFVGHEEDLRLGLLRRTLLSHALAAAPSDGRLALTTLTRFIRKGGSPFAPKVLASVTIAICPRVVATYLESTIRSVKQRLLS